MELSEWGQNEKKMYTCMNRSRGSGGAILHPIDATGDTLRVLSQHSLNGFSRLFAKTTNASYKQSV